MGYNEVQEIEGLNYEKRSKRAVLSFLNSIGRLNTSDLNDLGVKTGYSNGYLIGTALLCLVIGFLGVIALAYISDQLKRIDHKIKKFK